MSQSELTDLVEESDDPAKQLGSLESWNGQAVFVLRDDSGHFVTWRNVSEAVVAGQMAMTDGGEAESESVEFETRAGSDVTVVAEDGTLYVTVSGSFEHERAELTVERRKDVLYCGTQKDDDGTKYNAYVPVGDQKEEIEQLREASEPEVTDDPVIYTVEEYTKTSRAGGWGEREITKQRLTKNKDCAHMTERQKELHSRVDTDRVPDGFDQGDELIFDDLLDDARTREEREQDALDEAAETGEEVVINSSTTDCNDPSKECNLDHVSRVATSDGEIENRRTHTY